MAFKIDSIKEKLITGVRANLFQVSFRPGGPQTSQGEEIISFMCQAASIPSSDIASIPVAYFGRQFYLAGDRTFAPWRVQVINDGNFVVRDAFEKWHNGLNSRTENTRDSRMLRSAGDAGANYKTDIDVVQFKQDGTTLRTYKLKGAFPTTIGDIQLSWADNNSIEVFPVQFVYDYWTVEEGRRQGVTSAGAIAV